MTSVCMGLTKRRTSNAYTTLNEEKCQFSINKLVFMGNLLTDKGIGPTEERVRALMQAREPENVAEVRSFLDLANYSCRFIPQFATLSESLRQLTKKYVKFHFGPEQRRSFEPLNKSLAGAMTLACFDKKAPTKFIADALPDNSQSTCIDTPGSFRRAVHMFLVRNYEAYDANTFLYR